MIKTSTETRKLQAAKQIMLVNDREAVVKYTEFYLAREREYLEASYNALLYI